MQCHEAVQPKVLKTSNNFPQAILRLKCVVFFLFHNNKAVLLLQNLSFEQKSDARKKS